jgi:hypothetical protein
MRRIEAFGMKKIMKTRKHSYGSLPIVRENS